MLLYITMWLKNATLYLSCYLLDFILINFTALKINHLPLKT